MLWFYPEAYQSSRSAHTTAKAHQNVSERVRGGSLAALTLSFTAPRLADSIAGLSDVERDNALRFSLVLRCR